MGVCFLHGNGGANPLNFKVVGGTTEPSNPKENTIWVNTDTDITGYYFSHKEIYNMVEGDVWFLVGTTSPVAFDALKKNGIRIDPLTAKQYIDGAWVEKTALSYIGGEWVNWWNGELYKDGDTYDSITGGWSAIARGYNSNYKNYSGTPSVTYNESCVHITQANNKAGMWHTNNKISLSDRKTLTVNYSPTKINDLTQLQIRTGVSGYCFESSEIVATARMTTGTTSVSIDLRSLNLNSGNEYHICVVVYSDAVFDITSVKMI